MTSGPDGTASAEPAPGPRRLTVYDLGGPDRRIRWKRIPRLTRDALSLVWEVSRRLVLSITVLQLLVGGAVALQLLLGRRVLQQLIELNQSGAGFGPLAPEIALLVVVTLLAGLIGTLASSQQSLLVELVGFHTFGRIIDVASSVQISLYEDPGFHDELLRARSTGEYRTMTIVNAVNSILMAVLTSLGIGAALLTMHPLLFPLVVVASVPLLVATLINSKDAYRFEFLWTPQNRERQYLMELLTEGATAKEIRVFAATSFLRVRYDTLTLERLRRLREYLRKRVRVLTVGRLGGSIGVGIALATLVWLVVSDHVDVATAMTAAVAMQLLIGRFGALTRGIGNLVESGMFFDDYQSFLSHADAGEEPSAPGVKPDAIDHLLVENVAFHYPGTDQVVLEDVSLEVAPGEIVALVGENGSGKTTLVKLLFQLYKPAEGRILWNGIDGRDLDGEALRSKLTVIFQDFIQYHLTARENIALGRAGLSPDPAVVEEAARRAGAHGFLSRLPGGYETRLGREFYGGHELSVGQWQRLALARAFFRGGTFLVLDEPTASLDPRAEHDLFAQIRGLSRGRSVLLISHRFSSVRMADRIYVLERGRIIETGTHHELMAQEGHYAELFRLQAAAYLGGDPAGSTAAGDPRR